MIRWALIDDEEQRESRASYLWKAINEGRLVSLYIEPASSCNLTCKFCPFHLKKDTRKFKKGKGVMPLSLYKRVLDELENLPFRFAAIHFYLHGEPLLNNRLAGMISMAKERGLTDVRKVVTNGTRLYPSVFDGLIEGGATSITVSLDTVSREHFRKFKGKDLLPTIIGNIRYCITRALENPDLEFVIKCTIPGEISELNNSESENLINHFRGVAQDSSNIHVEIRQEFSWGLPGPVVRRPTGSMCDLPFYQLAINYDGVVSCCCNDLTYDLAIGQIGDSGKTLSAILSGKTLRSIKLSLLESNYDALQECKYCTLKMQNDLGQYRNELKALLT